ncbi:MAG: hypothetical protein JO180_01920 [Gemmatirosa sp.]|nr:hypothetical protein [Gemmatirosa sp.]
MSAAPHDDIPPAELAVARAIARRLGRSVYGVCDEIGGKRRLVDERPADVSTLAYQVDRGGTVRLGPAGRRAGTGGDALVHDPARIPAAELSAARDYALIMGRTVFVAELPDDPEARALHFAPPEDGTLRYAVRPGGQVVTGPAAVVEPVFRVRDSGWTARVGAQLRQLRRLRDRADELASLRSVTPRDWARVERLIPESERRSLRASRHIGAPGHVVADAIRDAVERELERVREAVTRDS